MSFKNTLFLFLSSRFFFFIAALLTPLFITLRQGYLGNQLNPLDPYWLWIWANFDGQHYLNIATDGYQGFNYAFFPFYPFLISLLHNLIPIPQLYWGLIISSLSLLASMFVIYKITQIDYDQKIASLSLFFISFFPLSFFYHSVYADALFLFLSTLTFYLARKKKWYWAALFGSMTTFTRLSGLSLIPALALEWYLQNKKESFKTTFALFIKKGLLPISLVGGGFIVFLLYLQIKHGDFMLFQKSMIAWQQSNFIFPLQIFFRYLKIFVSVNPTLWEYWKAVLELISFILYIILSIYVWKRIRSSYGLFMIILLLLVTFTGTLWGSPRYILHLFPAYLGLALLVNKNNFLRNFLILLFIILGIILSALFTRGYFVS